MRVCVCQLPGASIASCRESLKLIESLADAAALQGAGLALFPECAWPAYYLGSRAAYDEARAGGLAAPAHLLQFAQRLARRLSVMLCIGFVEEREGRLFNSAALIGGDGALLGVRSKSFLWDFDHDWFTADDRIDPVETPLGRIGIMICADARVPEIAATLVARGAQLILQPTAWVNGGTPERLWNPQPDFLISARAEEFGVPIASASKWSVEGATTFVGSSLVCDDRGRVLTRAGTSETTVTSADIELGSAEAPDGRVSALERRVLIGGPGLTAAESAELRSDWTRRAVDAAHRTGTTISVTPPHGQALSAADAARFGPARVATLLGVRRCEVFGDGVSEALVRARAAENRVFVIWRRGPGDDCAFDVRGRRMVSVPTGVDFDDREALDKRVADRTDIITDRRPGLYQF